MMYAPSAPSLRPWLALPSPLRTSRRAACYLAPSMGMPSDAAAAMDAPHPGLGADAAAFERAVAADVPALYRFCVALCRDRAEADDLLQETLVRAYLHRASFEGRGASFSWLCGIARNQHLEARRQRARRSSLLERVVDGCRAALEPLFREESEASDPEQAAVETEEGARLHRALHSLPEDFRLVVLLCDIEERSHEEAARVLGVPVGTVKSRQARGRARLAEWYRARGQRAYADGSGAEQRGDGPLASQSTTGGRR